MSDFKDRMIEAVERGWTDEAHAYEYVRESYADAADRERKRRKEEAPEERIVAIREDGSARVEPDEEPPDLWERAADEYKRKREGEIMDEQERGDTR